MGTSRFKWGKLVQFVGPKAALATHHQKSGKTPGPCDNCAHELHSIPATRDDGFHDQFLIQVQICASLKA
jgi:hypothetical protein